MSQASPYQSASSLQNGGVPGPHLAHIREADPFSITHMLERQRKDDFLSMASHELKTPITTLKAFLQLIASNEGPEVVVSRVHLKKMGDQVDRLTRLVTDLLEVHKIQKGELEFDRDRIDMDPLVMEVVADARVKHQTHRFTLTGASGCVITGDRARISQALSELLTNAVKFSPDTDLIEVNIACAGEKVDLTVSDHGIGLHDQEQDRIFDRYYRVLTDPAKPFPGLGVGLFIVSEIVRHHGGSVAVSSIPGEGSAFTMSFPVERDGNAGQ